MGHLLPYIATTTPDQFVAHTESSSRSTPPTTSINASSRSALLVESDKSLLETLRRYLNDMNYTVRTASNTEEALRLYRDFGQFNVVLIDYYIPEHEGIEAQTDCCLTQTAGTDLAKTILNIDPCQGMIFVASDFQNATDVPRPPELKTIPVLVDISFPRLRMALEAIEVVRA